MSEELAEANKQILVSNQGLHRANQEVQAANRELSTADQRLSHINADLDNFIYTASHDLKAPILNIEGLLKALQR